MRHLARRETYSPVRIYDRDKWICYLCGNKTERPTALTKLSDMARLATIDHVIPLALGGEDTKFNVRCACYGCNAAKDSDPAQVDIGALLFPLYHHERSEIFP